MRSLFKIYAGCMLVSVLVAEGIMQRLLIGVAIVLAGAFQASAGRLKPDIAWSTIPVVQPARLTCKQAATCRDAVILWCSGYSGADRDHDGIPCETVCGSRAEVEAIEQDIGCSL